jgi:CRP/FNR family cyclic AMP-dependent transcriptional regulator
MEQIEMLARVPLFVELGPRELKRLTKVVKERDYPAGEVILDEGDEAVGFFVVSSGRVQVVKDLGGPKEMVLATLGPGEFFGEMALLDGYLRTASVRALEHTHCLAMSRWDFTSELKGSPEMAVQILRTVVHRLRQTNARLTE